MTALHDFQADFLKKMLDNENLPGPMRIYRNNAQMILRDLLKGVFPATTLLLGEEFMTAATREFIKSFPPGSGDMNSYGADFPVFLAHIPSMRDYPYVPDVAKLEWRAHEAWLSPQKPPLTAEDLAAVADPLNLKLFLQPHVFLLRSGWPVDKLWAKVNQERSGLKNFEMKAEETFIAIYRDSMQAAVWSLSEGAFKFLEHLQADPSFAFAAESALRAEPDIFLDHVLAGALQAGFFIKTD